MPDRPLKSGWWAARYGDAVGSRSLEDVVDVSRHPLDDPYYASRSRRELDEAGVVVLRGFLRTEMLRELVVEAEDRRHLAFHSQQIHNVYLDHPEPELPVTNARSHTIVSTKGAITTDLLSPDSALHLLYDSPVFRSFLCAVLGEAELHPYTDPLSSINVNYYDSGQELGWHFDNSSFSVTLLVQAGVGGGAFEFIADLRDAAADFDNEEAVAQVLDALSDRAPVQLNQDAGDLVLFRGRDALHRVTPVEGDRSRLLVVFAYNTEPGLSLSENARMTFFGRLD